ncbi:uncharacterized protein [Clytia hemisphaerica]|uniref:uncharacterized protein n=1 Tax=Clytia hemisphaerica TaxID=252671 RepID=UPI0034D71967
MSGLSTHKTSSTGKYENTEQHPKTNKQKLIDASRSVINMDSGISPNQHEIILRHLEKLEKSSQGNLRNPPITTCGSLSSQQTSIERLAQDLTKSTYDNSSTAQLLQSLSVLQGERSDIPAMRKDIDSLKRSVDSTHTILKHLCVVVMEGNKSSGAEPPSTPNGVPIEEHERVVSEKDEQIQRIKQHADTMFDEYRCHIEKLKDEKALLAGEVISLKTTMSNVFTG